MSHALIGFCFAFALIFLRVPISVSLALTGFGGLVVISGWTPAMSTLVMSIKGSTMAYSLSVLPLFVLMGNLVAGAGISGNLFKAAQVFVGRQRGGLAMGTILACGAFGAICGSSAATAATMSRVAIPSMRGLGYADRLSAGTLAAGGTLGILIPPSVIMVIYGVSTQTHIGKLFAAGIIPGILGILLYMAAVKWTVWRDPSAAPMGAPSEWSEKFASLKGLWPVIILFGLVMGGIYGGWFTATEAAGIGAAGSFVFALAQKSLKAKDIGAILVDTALVSTAMIAILFGASMFVEFINLTGIHKGLEVLVKDSNASPFEVVLIIIAIYIVLGCLLESISMILITVPIFFPVIVALGYDPVWFGIIVVVATEIGLITPPIGVNLFVIRSIAPEISMRTIFSGMGPFITVDVMRILFLAVAPAVTLWLPNLLF